MSQAYLGEVRIFSFSGTPTGWAKCDGQTFNISQNTALFSILGTTYGGNGASTFALPNMQGRVVLGQGDDYEVGQTGGEAEHTLTLEEMASHAHAPMGGATASSNLPAGLLPGSGMVAKSGSKVKWYANSSNTTMNPASVLSAGAGAAHDNLSPTIELNFCIATTGIFPTHS
jgi:microcystin-dependent protein